MKNFAVKTGKEYFIEVYDKLENRYFKANIRKVCAEINLYTLPVDTKLASDILVIEKIYAESIEPMYLRAYKILTNDEVFEISDLQRIEMILSVLHFHMRNPRILKKALLHQQDEITRLYGQAKDKGARGLTYADEDFSFRERNLEQIIIYFSEKIVRIFKEKHIIVTKDISAFHEFAKIEINIAKENSQFITSDNPLAVEDYRTKLENPMTKSAEFNFPLDSKHSLRLYHDNTRELNHIRRGLMPNGSVNLINSTVYEQSSRFIFGNKQAFNEYFKLQGFLNEESTELIINAIQQVLEIAQVTSDNEEHYRVLEELYNKYKKRNFVSEDDKQIMMHKIRELNIAFRDKNLHQ